MKHKIGLAVAGFAAAISMGAINVAPQHADTPVAVIMQTLSPTQTVHAAEPTTPAIDMTYAFGAGMGSSYQTASRYVLLHDVGTESGAWQNAHYFYNNWNVAGTYTHFVVGDGGHIYELGEPGYQAWGAGSYANANAPVQIELAHTSDAATFAQDYAAYINLARYYARQYGIPLTLDDAGNGVKTHLWVTQNVWGDHTDPMGYLARWGVTRAKLAADIANGVNGAAVSTPQTTPAAQPSASAPSVNAHYSLRQMGAGWLSEVTNYGSGDNGFAGMPNARHDLLTIRVDHGSVRYQVHTQQSGWLDWVTGSDRDDTVNGCAGIPGQTIDGVKVYYTTPSGETYRQAYYRSQTTARAGWLPAVQDDTDYAGLYGEPLDRLQIDVGTGSPY